MEGKGKERKGKERKGKRVDLKLEVGRMKGN